MCGIAFEIVPIMFDAIKIDTYINLPSFYILFSLDVHDLQQQGHSSQPLAIHAEQMQNRSSFAMQ